MDRALAGPVSYVREAARNCSDTDVLVKHDRRSSKSVRTTALWLAAIAVAFYLGFIILAAIRT
jgi:hypothetical protein